MMPSWRIESLIRRHSMLILAVVGTVITLAFTLLPLSRATHWLIRGLDFPRIQLSIFSGLLLLLQFAVFDADSAIYRLVIPITFACFAWQLAPLLRYTFLWPHEVAQCSDCDRESQLSILISNVLTDNRDANSLIELVEKHRPDILVTLESDSWWQAKLAVLEAQMPHSVNCPRDNDYGMHVFSRLPLADEEVCFLVEQAVPSIHATVELRSGGKVAVHFLHPAPPSPTENAESEERDAELVVVARSVANSRLPVVVAGDLNDVPWSPTIRLFCRLSGLLDPRVGRGIISTFHADYPLLRWPLDQLFNSSHFDLVSIHRLASIGSDHFPLLTRLCLRNQGCGGENTPDPGEADGDWAKDITDTQQVAAADVPDPGEKGQ